MNTFKNKNLLIITNGYPNKDGSISDSVFVKDQVDELSKYFNKINVIVLAPYFFKFLKTTKLVKGYENRLDLQDYKYDNIEVYYARYFKLPNKISYKTFNLYNSVTKVIKKNNLKFDLIHAHFLYPSGIIASKIKRKYDKKLIITGHGFDVYDFPFKNKKNKQEVINALRNTDLFITVSNSNLKKINQIIDLKKNSKIIANGFSSDFKPRLKTNARKQLKLPLNKKILLNVASYKISIKNQLNLIYAINILNKKRADFVLYLIGSGPDEEIIKEKIIEFKLTKFIKVIGSKSHSEIPLWMNAADLFVLPSYNEGNPCVLFECLGCGIPFIGTNVGGIKEIISSRKFGLIYNNPKDYNKLSKLINLGLNKNWNSKEITTFVKKKYSWGEITKKLILIYKLMF